MGIFSNKESNEIGLELKEKDGKKHIILVHTMVNNGNKAEITYTTKINKILEEMQNAGYEIVDIKLTIGGTQNLSYETLITYK